MKNIIKHFLRALKIKEIIVLLIFISSYSYSWSQEFVFLGEGIKDEVRLFWIPKKSWPQGITGVNIKRKTTNGQWIKLNTELIVPGTVQSKLINNIGLSGDDLVKLNNKRTQLIQSGQLKEIESNTLINFMADENTLKGVSLMLNSDFDITLVAGFGYVDANIPNDSEKYEYGLFLVSDGVEENNPTAIYQWNYGTDSQIAVAMEGKIKPNKSRKTVELTWKVDVEDYKSYGILNGFNIYRKQNDGGFVKLSDKPIWISLKEKTSTLYFKDAGVDMDQEYIYAAAPNTIFNSAGVFSEIKLEQVPDIPQISPPKFENPMYKNGMLDFNWQFDSNNEPFIKGFYVQRKEDEGNMFANVSEMLTPNTRTFSYTNLPLPNNTNYHFKIVAVKVDGTELWSNRKIYFHQKQTKPSAPQNVKAEIINENGIVKVHLLWDAPEINAQSVTEYYLYTSHPNDVRVVKDTSLGKITTTTTEYTIHKNNSARYYFAVSCLNSNYEESPLSDKVDVVVPSKLLPFLDIWPLEQEGNVITLNWKYSEEIADLAGFQLFQNGELIVDETILTSTSRQKIITDLESGKHSFEMIAISESGVKSKLSKPRTFIVE